MAARSLIIHNGNLFFLLLSFVIMIGVYFPTGCTAIQLVTFSFEENTGAEYSIGRITDQQGSSSSNNYQFTGESSQMCTKYFNLVPSTSEVLTKVNIDREAIIAEIDTDLVSCQVSYATGTAQVQFKILDQNDVVPTIAGISEPISVYENIPIGQIITYLMPIDPDAGLNGTVNFTIVSGNEEQIFDLSISSGGTNSSDRLLTLRKDINYETHNSFNLTLFVTDAGTPLLNTTQHIILNIIDINDQVPTFDVDFHFNVSENHTIGSSHPIGIIDASDPDSPTHSQIFYQLDIENSRDSQAADYFAVNTTSGELYLIDRLDYDRTTKHLFEFRVEARNPGRPSGTKADITVTILDANDEIPTLIPTSSTLQGITENVNNTVFVFVFQDADTAKGDKDIGSVSISIQPQVLYTYDIYPHPFSTVVTITLFQPINREVTSELFISATVSDKGSPPLSSTINTTVPIFDVNDNPPKFMESSYQARLSPSSYPIKQVMRVKASDPDTGSNSDINYYITSVTPTIASQWFDIDNNTGLINLISQTNFELLVNGQVTLEILAQDNGSTPLNESTTLTITFPPFATFQPLSYQQYSNINVHSSSYFYMEFKTGSRNGVLLYQSSPYNTSLEIINGYVVFDKRLTSSVYVSDNKWYSLLLNKTENTLNVWEKENILSSMNNNSSSKVLNILQTANLRECSSQQQQSQAPLFIGGVPDVFTIPNGHLQSSGQFIGSIAAVVSDGLHIDLSCPYSQRNIVQGSHYTSACDSGTMCGSRAYCVPYTPTGSSPCYCNNGLPIDTCNEEKDYNPISLTNNSYVQFDLDYNFFYSLNGRQQQDDHHQTIDFTFIPQTTPMRGLLFYSKTSSATFQRLEFDQTFRYTVTVGTMPKLSIVSEPYTFISGKEYTLRLNLTSDEKTISMELNEKGVTPTRRSLLSLTTNTFGSGSSVYYPFVSQPQTMVSLGGTNNMQAITVQGGNFTGCITNFSINQLSIPLNGLLVNKVNNLTSPSGSYPFCHPCNNASTCSSNATCHPNGELSANEYHCKCKDNYINIGGTCLLFSSSITTTSTYAGLFTPLFSSEPVTDGLDTQSGFKFYYIVAIAGSSVFVLAVCLVFLAVMFRLAYTKGKKDTRRPQLVTQITYHQGSVNFCHDDKDMIDEGPKGGIVPVTRKNDYVKTQLLSKNPRASFDESDSVLDSINSPVSYRKSTSQETGFHSEGLSTRSSPHRRSASKDSERYDSDFTSFETDSEDLTATSGIIETQSPKEVHLVSSGSMMGVPTSFRMQNPLTSHEKNIMTPLQPNSSMLLSEDETDTEVSTTTNTNRRRYYDNDSLVSDQNGKWYKTSSPSTVVESENESPYGSKAAALHKTTRHNKHRPPSLPHLKPYNKSSPHGSPYSLGYPSQTHLSPLIKSHRPPTNNFEFPPLPPPHISPHNMYNGYLEHHSSSMIDQSRLPAIAESSFQYPPPHVHHAPYPPPSHHHTLYHHDRPPYDPTHAPYNPTHASYDPAHGSYDPAHASYDPAHTSYDPAHTSYDPSHVPYYPGYQGTSLTPGVASTTYCDLNSFSKVNPITYWEQQQRLRPTVDQDDPLRFLTEPCRKFEDVSTTPSVAESTIIDSMVDKDSAISVPTSRRPVTSRGVYSDHVVLPRTLPPHPLALPPESEGEDEEGEGEEEGESITHFPSADCTPTLLSSDNQQHSLSTLGDTQNSYHFPDYA